MYEGKQGIGMSMSVIGGVSLVKRYIAGPPRVGEVDGRDASYPKPKIRAKRRS